MARKLARRLFHLTGAAGQPALRKWIGRAMLPATLVAARRRGMDFPPQWDSWHRFVFATDNYERATLDAALRLVRPGDHVVDVGAHIGYYARHFSAAVGPTGHVFAFEPHPETKALLVNNVRRHKNVTVVEAAASDHDGESTFYDLSASGQHSLILNERPRTGARLREEIRVPTITLDRFLEERKVLPRLIKIDVEGGEAFVLRGLRKTIERADELAIILEYAPASIRAAGGEPAAFLEQIEALGLRWRPIGLDASELQGEHSESWDANLICTKGS